jgi:hypothetical protein
MNRKKVSRLLTIRILDIIRFQSRVEKNWELCMNRKKVSRLLTIRILDIIRFQSRVEKKLENSGNNFALWTPTR